MASCSVDIRVRIQANGTGLIQISGISHHLKQVLSWRWFMKSQEKRIKQDFIAILKQRTYSLGKLLPLKQEQTYIQIYRQQGLQIISHVTHIILTSEDSRRLILLPNQICSLLVTSLLRGLDATWLKFRSHQMVKNHHSRFLQQKPKSLLSKSIFMKTLYVRRKEDFIQERHPYHGNMHPSAKMLY